MPSTNWLIVIHHPPETSHLWFSTLVQTLLFSCIMGLRSSVTTCEAKGETLVRRVSSPRGRTPRGRELSSSSTDTSSGLQLQTLGHFHPQFSPSARYERDDRSLPGERHRNNYTIILFRQCASTRRSGLKHLLFTWSTQITAYGDWRAPRVSQDLIPLSEDVVDSELIQTGGGGGGLRFPLPEARSSPGSRSELHPAGPPPLLHPLRQKAGVWPGPPRSVDSRWGEETREKVKQTLSWVFIRETERESCRGGNCGLTATRGEVKWYKVGGVERPGGNTEQHMQNKVRRPRSRSATPEPTRPRSRFSWWWRWDTERWRGRFQTLTKRLSHLRWVLVFGFSEPGVIRPRAERKKQSWGVSTRLKHQETCDSPTQHNVHTLCSYDNNMHI